MLSVGFDTDSTTNYFTRENNFIQPGIVNCCESARTRSLLLFYTVL